MRLCSHGKRNTHTINVCECVNVCECERERERGRERSVFPSVSIDVVKLPLVPGPQTAFLVLKSHLCFSWLPMKIVCRDKLKSIAHSKMLPNDAYLSIFIIYIYIYLVGRTASHVYICSFLCLLSIVYDVLYIWTCNMAHPYNINCYREWNFFFRQTSSSPSLLKTQENLL